MDDQPLIQKSPFVNSKRLLVMLLLSFLPAFAGSDKGVKGSAPISPIDRLLADTSLDGAAGPSAGSAYAIGGSLADLAMDFRATRVGDVVTVVVAEQAT